MAIDLSGFIKMLPEAYGDVAPEGGASTCGDMIGGAQSLYLKRLADSLSQFAFYWLAGVSPEYFSKLKYEAE